MFNVEITTTDKLFRQRQNIKPHEFSDARKLNGKERQTNGKRTRKHGNEWEVCGEQMAECLWSREIPADENVKTHFSKPSEKKG